MVGYIGVGGFSFSGKMFIFVKTIMKFAGKIFNICIAAACTLVLCGGLSSCHSSKKVTKPSSTATVRPSRPSAQAIEQMRSDAQSRTYALADISRLVNEAAAWIGTPYLYAGNSRSGTDCSGFVMELFKKVFNVLLPRTSRDQAKVCTPLDADKLQPGDLVFFATGRDLGRVSHVGLYIGNGDMIHASSSRGVIISNLQEKYYASRFLMGGRHSHVDRLYSSAPSPSQRLNPAETTTEFLAPASNAATLSGAAAASIEAENSARLDSIISSEVENIFNPSFFD